MAIPYIIIDGYNLLHAAGLARLKYARGDLERCRQKLLAQIATLLTEEERHRCTVVFDAQDAPPVSSRVGSFKGLAIQFAEPGQQADDAIELLLDGHSAPQQVWLVSSDHRLQRAIKRKRGRPLDSDLFLAEFAQRIKEARKLATDMSTNPQNRAGPAVPVDVEYWLAEFGDIPLEQLEPEPLPQLPGLIPFSSTKSATSTVPPNNNPPSIPPKSAGTNDQNQSSKPQTANSPTETTKKDRRAATPINWQLELQALQQLLASPGQLEQWLANPNSSPRKPPEPGNEA